jgi:hypothetical protein
VEGLGAAVRDDERARVHRVDQGTMQGNAAAASVRHLRLVSLLEPSTPSNRQSRDTTIILGPAQQHNPVFIWYYLGDVMGLTKKNNQQQLPE